VADENESDDTLAADRVNSADAAGFPNANMLVEHHLDLLR
jgi:hypothetical protein